MEEIKVKKIDRRTRYTRMVIKDALLELLSEKEYADITVADLCRKAEINRGTFYLHYDNLRLVMDELFDDALSSVNDSPIEIDCAPAEKKESGSLCRFLRENKKYQPLFFSDSLHSHVVERIAASGWDRFVSRMREQNTLSEEVLKAIYFFQINGCLAISKRNIDIADESWSDIQCHVDRFLKIGFENL